MHLFFKKRDMPRHAIFRTICIQRRRCRPTGPQTTRPASALLSGVRISGIVTITFGNEKAIDILVAKAGNSRKTASVDVKGLKNPAPWAMGDYKHKKKHPDIYVFCYLNKPKERPQYFIVPKKAVDKIVEYAKDGKSGCIRFKDVYAYMDKWNSIWSSK